MYKMIKENILEIKKLVSKMKCMGTYGMVELELTKIENYVKELESKVKNLGLFDVSNSVCLHKNPKTIEEFPHLQYCGNCKKIINKTDC